MNKKTIIIIAVIVVAVAAIGIFVGYKFFGGESNEPVKVETFGYTTDEMVCNIKGSRKMILIQVSIESSDEEIIAEIEEKNYILTDLTNQIIRDTTEEELLGKEGQNRLQNILKEEAKKSYDTDTITDIFFKKFTIQN